MHTFTEGGFSLRSYSPCILTSFTETSLISFHISRIMRTHPASRIALTKLPYSRTPASQHL